MKLYLSNIEHFNELFFKKARKQNMYSIVDIASFKYFSDEQTWKDNNKTSIPL